VRRLLIHAYQFFIPTNLHAKFLTCAACGAGPVVGTKHISKHSKHHRQRVASQRPSSTSPLANANNCPSIACIDLYPILHYVCFYLLVIQIHHPCMRRELPCSIHTPASQTSGLEHGIKGPKPAPTSPKTRIKWLTEHYAAWYERLSTARVWRQYARDVCMCSYNNFTGIYGLNST
jgi:hypothetical protein